MIWLFLVIAILVGICIAIFFMPVEVRLQFERVNADDEGSLDMKTLYGLVHLHRKLTELTTDISSGGPRIRAKAATKDKTPEGSISVPHLFKFLHKILAVGRDSSQILKKTGTHVRIKRLYLELDAGLSDVVYTGVAVGILYASIESFFGWLSHIFQFDTIPTVTIRPVYNQMKFQLKTESIMRVPFGYAISACIRLLMAWRRRT